MSLDRFIAYIAGSEAGYLAYNGEWTNSSIVYMLSIILLNVSK